MVERWRGGPGERESPALSVIFAHDAEWPQIELAQPGSNLLAIANGQHHPVFTSIGGGQGTSCDTSAGPGGAEVGPAWYGLEVAHHGPDTGAAGKSDGCYQTAVVQTASGAWVPAEDTNPAID